MARAYLGLGGNLGDPLEAMRTALQMLHQTQGISVKAVSSVYLTEPVGFTDQPKFLNCAAEIETSLEPEELLKVLQGVENGLGRVRTIRWGPRVIDLDILLFDNLQMESETLTIPHPGMMERAFVLVPLAEIAPKLRMPDGRSMQELVGKLKDFKKLPCIHEKLW